MTEAEWLASDSPVAILRHLKAGPNDRKVLLYASALCRLRPELLTKVLEVWARRVEAVLDGTNSGWALDKLQESAESEAEALAGRGPHETRAFYSVLADVVFFSWCHAATEYETDIAPEALAPMRRLGASLVRDLAGNPFHPVPFNPDWRTDAAVALARQMYESRDFGAMPILADALQDAGCEDADILSHCRNGGPHVRGCWVIDLVLNKK